MENMGIIRGIMMDKGRKAGYFGNHEK